MYNKRGFITTIILTLVGVSIVGVVIYYFTVYKNSVIENPKETTERKELFLDQNFIPYISPLGFEISYPKGWKIIEHKGVDASLGGVEFYSPGTTGTRIYYAYEKDAFEQAVSIYGGATLNPNLTLKAFVEYQQGIFRKNQKIEFKNSSIIDEGYITLNNSPAYKFIYNQKTEKYNLKNVLIIFLPNTESIENANLSPEIRKKADILSAAGLIAAGLIMEMQYSAREDVFDQKIVDSLTASFKENILLTYIKNH